MAVILDTAYQLYVLGTVYPVQVLIVAVVERHRAVRAGSRPDVAACARAVRPPADTRDRTAGVANGHANVRRREPECGMTRRACVAALIAVLLAATSVADAQTTTQLWGNLTFELGQERSAGLRARLRAQGAAGRAGRRPGLVESRRHAERGVLAAVVGRPGRRHDRRLDQADRRRGHDRGDAAAGRAAAPVLARPDAPPARTCARCGASSSATWCASSHRNFFYSGGDTDSDSTVRFRNRLEFQLPLNKPRMTDDGTRYLLADWEWFIPLDDPERAIREPAADSRRPGLPPQLQLALRSALHVDAVAQHARRGVQHDREHHRHPREAAVLRLTHESASRRVVSRGQPAGSVLQTFDRAGLCQPGRREGPLPRTDRCSRSALLVER